MIKIYGAIIVGLAITVLIFAVESGIMKSCSPTAPLRFSGNAKFYTVQVPTHKAVQNVLIFQLNANITTILEANEDFTLVGPNGAILATNVKSYQIGTNWDRVFGYTILVTPNSTSTTFLVQNPIGGTISGWISQTQC